MARKSPSQKFNPAFEWSLLHPKHWPLWCVFGVWWLLVQLPYPLQILLGKAIGTAFLLAKERRTFAARNLELCFPEKTLQERNRILRKSFQSAGIAIFEMGIGWWWPEWRLRRLFTITGMEHIEKAEREGIGVLFLGMHFTTLDIAGSGFGFFHTYGSMEH